jgi:membrane protein implicated in regulation of membrane protease activity
MRTVQETYDLPRRPGVAFWQWLVMLAVPAIAIGLWLVLPDSPITVAVLAIAVLAAVFVGVGLVLSSRQASEPPGEHPITPPSVERS